MRNTRRLFRGVRNACCVASKRATSGHFRPVHALVSALAGTASPMSLAMRSAVAAKPAPCAFPANATNELAFEDCTGNARAAATSLVRASFVSPLVSDSRASRNSARAVAAESAASVLRAEPSRVLSVGIVGGTICASSAEGPNVAGRNWERRNAERSTSRLTATMRVFMGRMSSACCRSIRAARAHAYRPADQPLRRACESRTLGPCDHRGELSHGTKVSARVPDDRTCEVHPGRGTRTARRDRPGCRAGVPALPRSHDPPGHWRRIVWTGLSPDAGMVVMPLLQAKRPVRPEARYAALTERTWCRRAGWPTASPVC